MAQKLGGSISLRQCDAARLGPSSGEVSAGAPRGWAVAQKLGQPMTCGNARGCASGSRVVRRQLGRPHRWAVAQRGQRLPCVNWTNRASSSIGEAPAPIRTSCASNRRLPSTPLLVSQQEAARAAWRPANNHLEDAQASRAHFRGGRIPAPSHDGLDS